MSIDQRNIPKEVERNPSPLSSPSLNSNIIQNLKAHPVSLVDSADYPFDYLTPPLYHSIENCGTPHIKINHKVWFKWLMEGCSKGKHYYGTSAKDPTSSWHPNNLSKLKTVHPVLEVKQFGLASSYTRIKRELEPPQAIQEDPKIEEIIKSKRIKIEYED